MMHNKSMQPVNQLNRNLSQKRRIGNGETGIETGIEIRREIETGIVTVDGVTGTGTRIETGTGGEIGTGTVIEITSETGTGIGIETGIRNLTSFKIMGLQSNLRKVVWTCTLTWSHSLQKDTCCLKMAIKWSHLQRVTDTACSK